MKKRLTYLKTLVTGKAKTAELVFCGDSYPDALKTLERKFNQPPTILSAHLHNLSYFPQLNMRLLCLLTKFCVYDMELGDSIQIPFLLLRA